MAEDAAIGSPTGITAMATDADAADEVVYALIDDAGGRFSIDPRTGEIRVASPLDAETAIAHDVIVTAKSGDGSTTSQSYTIGVADVAEHVTLADGGVGFVDAGIAELSVTGGDGDDVISTHETGGGSIAGGRGNDTIEDGTGHETAVYDGAGADYAVEEAEDETVIVRDLREGAPEGTDTLSGIKTLRFSDTEISMEEALNRPPGEIAFAAAAVEENAIGAVLGQLSADDPDEGDTLRWSVDDSRVFVDEAGLLRLADGQSLDFEKVPLTLDVTATDRFGLLSTRKITGAPDDTAEWLSLGDDSVVFDDIGVSEFEISGGAGADHITTHASGGTARGGANDDTLIGRGGDDLLDGGAGRDTIKGGGGADTLIGGDGDDSLWSGSGHDYIEGGDGADTLDGDTGNDTLDGGAGDDRLIGWFGDDVLDGGDGNDRVDGGNGDDTLSGSGGDDTILGWIGADSISGGNGNDVIDAGSGGSFADEDGNDTVHGGAGHDMIRGGYGDDLLHGDDDNDTILGGHGDDTIVGGRGDDSLEGADGSDQFWIGSGEGADRVDGDIGWTDLVRIMDGSGPVYGSGNAIDGEGWTVLVDDGHSVTGVSDGNATLSQDAAGIITFDEGGSVSFAGIEQINW
ncbi:cadherin domain-containing protein [Palleronia aestuarii]|nr:cadherin domain-containing protein [Palleronia aestuarii]